MSPMGPDEQSLEVDVLCHQCGYNLRGLSEQGRCPECGTVISESIRGDWLAFADPNWLKKLAAGAQIIVWSTVLLCFVALAASAIRGDVYPLVVRLAAGVALLIGMMYGYGVWSLTAPESAGTSHRRSWSWRKPARATLIAWLLFCVLHIGFTSIWGEATKRSAMVIGMVIFLVQIAGQACELFYIGELARRLPNGAVTGQARFLGWGFVVAGVGLISGLISIAVRHPVPYPGGSRDAGTLLLVMMGGLALVIFAIWALLLLYRFGRMVRRPLRFMPAPVLPPAMT